MLDNDQHGYYRQYYDRWQIACFATGKQSDAAYSVHNGINAAILSYCNWNGVSLSGHNTHAPSHFRN